MDNIVKPILDGLCGVNGLIIDDMLFNRVIVNWQDTEKDDHFDIEIEYAILMFHKKSELIYIKSNSGWCLPANKSNIKNELPVIKKQLEEWDSVNTIDDYYNATYTTPILEFIYHSKIQDKGFDIISA